MALPETSARAARRRRLPNAKATLSSRLEAPLHRFHAWKSRYQYLGRYSVEKLCAFHHYQEHTSLWRVAAVIAISPLPPFFALLLMDVVPMNDPRAGATANGVAFTRSVIAHAVLPTMILLSTKQALQLSDRVFSIARLFRIGTCISLVLEFFCIGAAFVWRFPVPFREVTAIPLFVACVVFFMWHFGKDELKKKVPMLMHYLTMVTMQLSMYYTFVCLAVAFDYLSAATQIILVLIFPAIKLGVKRAVWTQAQKLPDLSTDVTICFIELTGALYQTVCLQFAKTHALQYVILFSDLFQAMYEVRAYVFHEYITDGVSTVQTAVRIVLSSAFPGAEEHPLGTEKKAESPTFFSGSGTSVFLKAKMVRTSTAKQPLDLNQYKYEVVAPDQPTASPLDAQAATTEGLTDLAAVATELEEKVAAPVPPLPHRKVEIAPARHRQLDASASSARSAASSGRSHYHIHSSTDNSAYGISRGTTGSASLSSAYISPAQEAMTVVAKSATLRPRLLPPLQRAASTLATFGNARRGSDGPSSSAFSVYDPSTSSAPEEDERSPNRSFEHETIVRRSSMTAIQSCRRSFQSAIVHPDAATEVATKTPEATERRHSRSEGAIVGKVSPTKAETQKRVMRVMIDGIQLARRDQARVLEQTLQLLFSCEVLVFVEFLEVLMPTIYGLVVGGLWALYNARYNLLFISMSYESMLSSVTSSFAYAALESLSLGVMVYVMKKRYGLSALHLLAFVLEKYWKVLYGKLLGSFLVIWLTLNVHLGTDFTFTYDYGVILERFGTSRFKDGQ